MRYCPPDRPPTGLAIARLSASSSSLVVVKLVLVALCWGGTFIAGRILAPLLPAMTAAAGRFALAVPLLLLLAWRQEGGLPRLNHSQILATAALGLSGIFLYNFCFLTALAQMPANRTALFVALNPIVTALLAAALLRERLAVIRWAGIAIAFVGAAIIISQGNLDSLLTGQKVGTGAGEAAMLLAVLSWAVYTLLGRMALRELSPIAATTYASLWGLAFLVAGAGFTEPDVAWERVSLQAWAAMAYLGIFGTALGFVWYYEGVKAIGPSRAAVFTNLVPAFGVALAAILLQEPIVLSMVVGGLLVAVGIRLANR